jgi:hypothetical protein
VQAPVPSSSRAKRSDVLAIEDAADAMSIERFCQRHDISQPTYFKLRQLGLGPDEMRFGRVVRISDEAARRWRAAREKPSGAEAKNVAADAAAIRKKSMAAAEKSVTSAAHVSNQRKVRRK